MDDTATATTTTASTTIDVYCRIRPTRRASRSYACDESGTRVILSVPRRAGDGYVNNQRDTFEFPFAGVFDQDATQEDVFARVAAPVVDSVLDGYNGTIFAYGQTGSGKTYTITGGAREYDERGIIPRSLARIFAHADRHASDNAFTVRIQYLEIYNNAGYNLLDGDRVPDRYDNMTKVVLREDEDGRIQYTGLDPITTTSLEDALNLLFYGDLNRIVEKTPMNDGSSRSHCIFMVQVESRSQRTGLIRRSRLNLVDLAGSERVAKTQVDGKILTEARRINLSLHYLEQVIVALHEQAQGSARVHVPYRNSMITTILKDSLGGNCRTVMVATVNVEQAQVDESISTCRFAQRVAMIVNDAKVNEELDPAIVIARLKRRVQELEAQLAVARPGDDADGEPAPFDDSARARCDTLVDEFVNSAADDDDEQASVTILSALAGDRIAYCLRRLKTLVGGAQQQRAASAGDAPANPHAIVRLKKVIEDRDNEIAILVGMLKAKEANGVANVRAAVASTGASLTPAQADEIVERRRAFDEYRTQGDSETRKQMQAGVEDLQAKIVAAKSLGERLNATMKTIDTLKDQLQQQRMRASVRQITDGEPSHDDANEIADLERRLDGERHAYGTLVASLRQAKKEIEHVQHWISKLRVRMQKEFDRMWDDGAKRNPARTAVGDAPRRLVATGDAAVDADIARFYQASRSATPARSQPTTST
ncbi:unnamed protein product (mitochondrion) [Plasmodiophora brassicae]|uniref:Kinesin-like protein n=1 Tax=Plasmodiophora brassicae TaxID=37360 RepID=A0A3P3Y562_PLABS|nr:unnamed protein product [Plasmodiophora brassicae]